jgi:Tol biopolymer transport system component
MKLRPRRAVLTCALVATVVALALTAKAQANTTLPGGNGKIAYTTNATVLPADAILSAANSTRLKSCDGISEPLGAEIAGFPFNVLLCNAEIATINPDGSGFVQVTNNNVPDDMPAWLPQDGAKLAYQSVALDPECTRGTISCSSYNLFDITPDGATGHQLTSTPGPDELFNSQSPSYSPDGSTIAFDALPIGGLKTVASRDFTENPLFQQFNHLFSEVLTVPAGGEGVAPPVPLVPASEDQPESGFISDSQPTYSPDGKQIAFVRLTIGPATSAFSSRGILASVTSSIYVAPATGGASHPVESTPPCDLTPGLLGAVLAQSATGAPVRTSRGATVPGPRCTFDAAPAWSPDGSKIAVERITFPEQFLVSTDARGGGLVDPTSPFIDSDIVVFNSSDGSGETNLSDVTEGSGDCTGIAVLKSGYACSADQKPAWSPDSTKIAFFSDRDSTGLWPGEQCVSTDTGACDDEIWTMNADGSSPAQLTNNDVNDINPDWQRIQAQPTPPAQPASPVKPAVGVAGVRRACVAKTFHVRFRVTTANSSVKSVVVKLDGHRIKSTSKGSFTLTINGKKLKSGRHRLTITATDSAGHVTTTHKSFSVCKAAKPRHKAAPRFTG